MLCLGKLFLLAIGYRAGGVRIFDAKRRRIAGLKGWDKAGVGCGEMARLIAEKDWSQTALARPRPGPKASSGRRLRSRLGLPMGIRWGRSWWRSSNDAYAPLIGEKHRLPWEALCVQFIHESYSQLNRSIRRSCAANATAFTPKITIGNSGVSASGLKTLISPSATARFRIRTHRKESAAYSSSPMRPRRQSTASDTFSN